MNNRYNKTKVVILGNKMITFGANNRNFLCT